MGWPGQVTLGQGTAPILISAKEGLWIAFYKSESFFKFNNKSKFSMALQDLHRRTLWMKPCNDDAIMCKLAFLYVSTYIQDVHMLP